MPRGEQLADLAAHHGATLVIHLGAQAIDEIVATLAPHYGADCPAAVVARASWPDEVVLRARLATIAADVRDAGVTRTATILVGPAAPRASATATCTPTTGGAAGRCP